MGYMNYEERLEVAKRLYELSNDEQKTALECIFPELCESEDEKVRKALIEYFNEQCDMSDWNGVYGYQVVAWLEKQGQEPRKVPIWKHWKDGICGNGEGKLIYLIKNGDDYSLSSSLGFECDYILLSDLDNLMLEKQGEQKSSDKDMKEALRTEYEKGRADAIAQMQKGWSDKEKIMYADIIEATKKSGVFKEAYKRELVDWLKSLKDRYTWKPSDAQIRALEYIINNAHNTSYSCKIAKELLEQLRKLKGE